jgi:hypothetical protein
LGGLAALAFAAACYTGIDSDTAASSGADGGSGGDGGDDGGVGDLECNGGQRGSDNVAMRRKTRAELLQSLQAVVGPAIMQTATVGDAAALIPGDSPGDLVADFQNGHAYEHAHGMLVTAQAVAAEVADDDAASDAVFGECGATADLACAEAFVDTTGLRILGRPLDDARRQSILDGFVAEGEGIDGMKWLLARLVQSPEAVFHLEVPRSDCDAACLDSFGGLVPVDDWTVASRLSYALTGQGPDDGLLAAAAAGKLRSLAAVRPHAMRLVQSEPARRKLAEIVDSWLTLGTLPDANTTVASVAGIDAEGLTEEAHQELLDYVAYMVLETDADATALLEAPLGFPRSERMAALYGSQVALGDEPVTLEGGHGGLLLRIAPLMSGQLHTSPILRGAYVRKRLLCDEVPAPDPETVAAGLEELEHADRTMVSTRELIEELTSPPLCASCHQLVNPIGFVVESFDPLGRWRNEEIVYDAEGNELARHPIDTHVDNPTLEEGGPTTLEGPADLMAALAESTKLRACIAERLVTHTQLRPVSDADECAIEEVEQALLDGSSVADAWIDAVAAPELFVRAKEESP